MPILVRAACLTHYVDVARSVGLDPWRLLSEAGLSRACIEDPELKISVESVRQLLETSAALSGVEAFALLMAEGRRLSNLGVVGMLTREEPTLRLGLQSFARYGRLHNEALLQRIEESQGIATIHEELLLGSVGPSRQATELVIGVSLRLLRLFLGADWRARRICFTHPEPADMTVHRRVLGQTPEFGHEFNGIVCSSADLDTPIASADPVMASYLRQQLHLDARAAAGVSDEVRHMIVLLLPRGRCTIEQVARFMGVHRRTLHRRLALEGHTFIALVQAIRQELWPRYAEDRRRPLTEVAQLLGFADLSSFSRWHRGVYGQTAERWRAALPAGAAARPAPG